MSYVELSPLYLWNDWVFSWLVENKEIEHITDDGIEIIKNVISQGYAMAVNLNALDDMVNEKGKVMKNCFLLGYAMPNSYPLRYYKFFEYMWDYYLVECDIISAGYMIPSPIPYELVEYDDYNKLIITRNIGEYMRAEDINSY